MEDQELKQLWASYNQNVELSLKLNHQARQDTATQRIVSLLRSMRPIKVFALLVGILWVGFVDQLIIEAFGKASWFFVVSASLQSLITKFAIGTYLYQLILIQQVDFSQPILDTQQKLANLQTSTLRVARILFLQLPLWSTFYLSTAMLSAASLPLLALQVGATLALTGLAGWLFVNIKPQNRHQPWFVALFGGNEWTPLTKAMTLLDDLRSFEQ